MTTATCPACGSNAAKKIRCVHDFNLFQCSCGLKFMTEEQLKNVDYDAFYSNTGGYDSKLQHAKVLQQGQLLQYGSARRSAIRHIDALTPKPRTALEIGCGVGDFLQVLERRDIRCWGSDVSENAIGLAKSHLKNSTVSTGILTRLTYPEQTYDLAVCWEVLEHVHEVCEFLSVIFDLLNPGGTFLMSTPNYDSRLMWKDIELDPRSGPPIHVTYWNAEALARVLRKVGFSQVSVEHHSTPMGPARRSGTLLDRMLVVPKARLIKRERKTLLGVARK